MNKLLSEIQSELKAPKGQTNKFGGYQYRSCEDIIEAVKPLLAKRGVSLTISDEVIAVLDRIYVKSTAILAADFGEDTAQSIEVSAYAREPESQKGMSEAQLTGSTSSYARKYALNGLFAIDDTKDADTQDNRVQEHRFKAGEKDEITKQVRECLNNGDGMGLKQILDEYQDPDEKMKVWGLFTSTERSSIKAMLEN